MEFSEEFIKEQGLNEDQVKGITSFATEHIQGLKGQWDGKANDNAEGILNGAADAITKVTGVKREQGQKIADFISSAWDGFSTGKTEELNKAKLDYETKLKDFKGGDALKGDLDKAKQDLDDAQKKYADYDTLKEASDKYTPLKEEYATMKKRVAYGSVKPNFPDTVNAYEASAKWSEFISGVEKDYTIEFDGDKAIAVNKVNKHIVKDLKELVDKDENIKALLVGRQQNGTGAQSAELKDIEGVPFKVPADADSKIRAKIIKEHLASIGVSQTDPTFAKQFSELNKKILLGKKQAA